MSNEDWMNFTEPKNYTAQIIMAYFVLMNYVISVVALDQVEPSFKSLKGMSLVWIERIAEKLPARYKKYIEWPLAFAKEVTDAPIYSQHLLRVGTVHFDDNVVEEYQEHWDKDSPMPIVTI